MFSGVVRQRDSISEQPLDWRKLQQVGLNAYEARSYLVLLGHARFKALELAARARVPRQKIYEVLDCLVEKGFARVVQEKTKLFSAIDPSLAIPGHVARRSRALQSELTEQSRLAGGLVEDLRCAYLEGQDGQGTLDFLNLVSDATQTAIHYRRMLASVNESYAELSRPPFAVDPLDEQLVKEAAGRRIRCRLIVEEAYLDDQQQERLREYREQGIEIRFVERVPLKLALFDNRGGMLALLDPVSTTPSWTALIFEHSGFAEAMSGLFESYWSSSRAQPAPLFD
jgi:hypothetical protein